MGIIKAITPAQTPLVDLANYPVIYASCVARVDRISHGMLNIAMAEERMSDDGVMERVIVCRLIRPAASVIATAAVVAQIIGEVSSGSELAELIASTGRNGMQ